MLEETWSVCQCVHVCVYVRQRKGEEVDRITRALQICMLITSSLWKLAGTSWCVRMSVYFGRSQCTGNVGKLLLGVLQCCFPSKLNDPSI